MKKVTTSIDSALKDKAPSLAEVVQGILTQIRQHEPEQQNEIVSAIIKQLSIDRFNKAEEATQVRQRAQRNLEDFVVNNPSAERWFKEFEANKQTKG